MKHGIAALALLCVLTINTMGGDIPSVGIAPPPPPSDGMQATTAPGEIPTGRFSYEIADTALDLIQMFMSAGI